MVVDRWETISVTRKGELSEAEAQRLHERHSGSLEAWH